MEKKDNSLKLSHYLLFYSAACQTACSQCRYVAIRSTSPSDLQLIISTVPACITWKNQPRSRSYIVRADPESRTPPVILDYDMH